MRKILLPLLALVLFAIACNKTPDANPDRAAMLRHGNWRISDATVMMKLPNGRDTLVNYYSLIPACRADDYLKFDSLNHGSVHNGGTSCSLADADSVAFVWQLKNNDNVMDIFNGFTLIDSVAQTLYPYHIDTVNATSTPIVLDTIANAPTVVLDTMYTLKYSASTTSAVNIYNASIVNFTQASFKLNFDFVAHYLKQDWYISTPIFTADTFHYSVTYTNF